MPAELRCYFNRDKQELRVIDTEGQPSRIMGLAVPYGELSHDLGGFQERFRAGAFTDSLRSGNDIRADVEHNSFYKLGRTSKNTMRVREEDRGIYIDIDVPDTSTGRDVLEEVRRGDLDGMSIVFTKEEDTWTETESGTIREVGKANLLAVTLTGNPAYPQTKEEIQLRSLDFKQWKDSQNVNEFDEYDQNILDATLELVDLELDECS